MFITAVPITKHIFENFSVYLPPFVVPGGEGPELFWVPVEHVAALDFLELLAQGHFDDARACWAHWSVAEK